MFKMSACQMEVLGQRLLLQNLSRFREILTHNRTLGRGENRDAELERYLLSGWRLGLRQPRDLVMFATTCFHAGGDVSQVASLRGWIAESLSAPEGPMMRLMLSLPVSYWVNLRNKLPPGDGGWV
jgi:hypothetical protein